MRYQPPDAQARQAFHQGVSRTAYQMLGAHRVIHNKSEFWHFAVWAPNALAVSLTGAFCGWDRLAHPMTKQYDGTWELRLPASAFDGVEPTYKYAVCCADGQWRMRTDPYAFYTEKRPGNAAKLYDMDGFAWTDARWMRARAKWDAYHSPMNIYELHLGSWRRTGAKGETLSYDEIARQLVPYVRDMGYTHVELMPVMEHPLDMSWGYQVTGYYAATSRYGEPKGLMRLIDALHNAGIGVILDWVPAHFPKDECGLRQFDGTPCYEHADPRRAEMPQWGTLLFDFARGEACSFLLSNACFWLEYFHADGIRVDAVSSMLYHDFCREPGQWLPNCDGGRDNIEAAAFLRLLNQTVYRDFPGIMMIAEESSAYPMVTKPVHAGGLGFGFKWNMGWMNDILSYIEYDPIYRRYHHDKITFSLMYAFSENYILPFSHDEVVHGKHSMLDKQPGDLWRKFAGLRALYGYTMAHPGKKLLFMGGEFGQFIEWKFDDELDWFLLGYERHPDMQNFVRELNRFYRKTPALYQIEDSWDGFEWLEADDSERSVVVFIRRDKRGRMLVCVTNFTPAFYPMYVFGLPRAGVLTEVLNSDLACYGGSNQYNSQPVKTEKVAHKQFAHRATVCLPPLCTVYFSFTARTPRDKHTP